jgi:hypothetical protein
LGEAENKLYTLDKRLAARETNEATLGTRLGEITGRIDSLPHDTLILNLAGQPSLAEAQQWSGAAEHLALRAERRAIEARDANLSTIFAATLIVA